MSHSVFLARRLVATIHRVAENGPSRKLIYGILDAYTLEPGKDVLYKSHLLRERP